MRCTANFLDFLGSTTICPTRLPDLVQAYIDKYSIFAEFLVVLHYVLQND